MVFQGDIMGGSNTSPNGSANRLLLNNLNINIEKRKYIQFMKYKQILSSTNQNLTGQKKSKQRR